MERTLQPVKTRIRVSCSAKAPKIPNIRLSIREFNNTIYECEDQFAIIDLGLKINQEIKKSRNQNGFDFLIS